MAIPTLVDPLPRGFCHHLFGLGFFSARASIEVGFHDGFCRPPRCLERLACHSVRRIQACGPGNFVRDL